MNNKQKNELREVIKSIPSDRLRSSIKHLWQRYYPEVSYGTFRQYLKIFKQDKLKEMDANSGGDGQ